MRLVGLVGAILLTVAQGSAIAEDVVTADEIKAAEATMATFKANAPGIQTFIDKAHGYAVFPNVGQAGLIVGGAYGKGVVYEGGRVVGAAEISEAKIGLVAGVQSMSQVVFFETEEALERLTKGQFAFGAEATAVAAKKGAATGTSFRDGVATFITDQKGLMGNASVGGQSFNYKPIM